MSIGQRYYTPYPFEVDTSGVPIVGAQLFFYLTQTSTPLDTYSDVTLGTPNPNPVVAGSDGRFPDIWLDPSQAYKVRLFTANPDPSHPSTPSDPQGTQIWTADPVGPASGGASQNISGIVGEVRAYAGIPDGVPAQWYLCYGQAVSRTTYSAAFTVLGTAWGDGDGTTTFNLPDLRGRGLLGLDNMGGVAANRITAGVSGIPGTTLGGTGGDQNPEADTLTAATTVSITDPGHAHDIRESISYNTTGTPNYVAAGDGNHTPVVISGAVLSATTGVTATAVTTASGAFAGESGNVQPSAMINYIIYLGA